MSGKTIETTPTLPLGIGAPVWACTEWSGEVYPPATPRDQWLSWYSRTFNVVEGNSTFYALPAAQTFQKWAEQTAHGFQFCFKFPRDISHVSQLQNCREATHQFLGRLEVLAKAERLGPTFLQLSPTFSPDRIGQLKSYLQSLPREFPWAVEVRHQGWFDSDASHTAGHEQRLDELLRDLKIDKVLFDSRPLFQSPPDDAIEIESQRRKPKTPLRRTVTAQRPMLRIVGRNRIDLADRFLAEWAPIVAQWIVNGLRPIIFTHAPDDAKAPALARRFLGILQAHLPDISLSIPLPERSFTQLSLFDDQN